MTAKCCVFHSPVVDLRVICEPDAGPTLEVFIPAAMSSAKMEVTRDDIRDFARAILCTVPSGPVEEAEARVTLAMARAREAGDRRDWDGADEADAELEAAEAALARAIEESR